MRVCDVCKDAEHQPVSSASIHVHGKSSGSLDLCDGCIALAATRRSSAKSAAASRRRLQPWVPRELTDSEAPDSAQGET